MYQNQDNENISVHKPTKSIKFHAKNQKQNSHNDPLGFVNHTDYKSRDGGRFRKR